MRVRPSGQAQMTKESEQQKFEMAPFLPEHHEKRTNICWKSRKTGSRIAQLVGAFCAKLIILGSTPCKGIFFEKWCIKVVSFSYLFLLLIVFMGIFSFVKSFSLIPLAGVTCCAYLMIEIPAKSWMVFFGWMALGLSIYFLYGRSRSKLARQGWGKH